MKASTVALAALGAAVVAGVSVALARRGPPRVRARAPDPVLPAGWRRFRGRITPALRGAALVALKQDAPIGTVIPLNIGGRTFGAFLEWHDDPQHGRHRGVSLLVPAA